MDDEHASHLGGYISRLRKERKLTVRQLAALANIDNGGLTRIEAGKVRSPRPATLRALALALKTSLADLYAIAGYTLPNELPDIEAYLRTKYPGLSGADVRAIATQVQRLTEEHTVSDARKTPPART